MPSKQTYLVFFLAITAILLLLQWFVYRNLSRVLRRDFQDRYPRLVASVKWIFVAMNIPIAFLFFRRQIHSELPVLTKILLYPFTIWQALILVWTVVLVPVTLIRIFRSLYIRNRSHRTT